MRPEAEEFSGHLKHLLGEGGRFNAHVGYRLRRAQLAVVRAFTVIAGGNIRQGTSVALGLICDNPGISQNVVSRALGIDKSATVQLIDDLETRGYVVRRRAADDRRRHALHVTDHGKLRLEALEAMAEELNQRLRKRMTQKELEQLNMLLDHVYLACVDIDEEQVDCAGCPDAAVEIMPVI